MVSQLLGVSNDNLNGSSHPQFAADQQNAVKFGFGLSS
jgi:hypothetical protein